MPFEINEIDIRLRIGEGSCDTDPITWRPAHDEGAESGAYSTLDHAAIVEDCVQRVLRILKAQQER